MCVCDMRHHAYVVCGTYVYVYVAVSDFRQTLRAQVMKESVFFPYMIINLLAWLNKQKKNDTETHYRFGWVGR